MMRCYDPSMASMDSVHQKMYRARHHYIELQDELVEYYTGVPGTFEEGPGSRPDNPAILFRENKPIPRKFALILGDALQCMRSSLDYLIFELVEARGKPHHRNNQFLIASTVEEYRKCIRGHYLDGISVEARAKIEEFQPFMSGDPVTHHLAVLNKLVNINKHRRVILTNFVSQTLAPTRTLAVPHIRGNIRARSVASGEVFFLPMWAYVTIKDEAIQDVEIVTVAEQLSEYLIRVAFPVFERFFS